MRICPSCGFDNNQEGFATCVWCNTSLADAVSVPHPDPAHPDHEKCLQQHKRGRMYRGQLIEAVALYSLVITFFTLSGIGYAWAPLMLLCAFASGVVTGAAVVMRWLGQLTAPVLQAAMGAAIAVHFVPANPAMSIMFFTLGSYVFAAVLLSIWIDHIRDMNR